MYIPKPAKPTLKSLKESFLAVKQIVEAFEMLIPTGSIIEWPSDSAPTGRYLVCDGRELNIADYPDLFQIIGYKYGSTTLKSTFFIPDSRGNFFRGEISNSSVNGSGVINSTSNTATFTNHGFNRTGFKVRMTSGTFSGLITAATYYVIVVDANTLAFASTYNNALNKIAISISGTNDGILVQYESPDSSTRLAALNGSTSGVGTREADAQILMTGAITGIQSYSLNNVIVTGVFGRTGGAQGNDDAGREVANLLFNNSYTSRTSTEDRPTNVATRFIIKY